MNKNLFSIPLPDFGALKVNLPIISFGEGRPKITIICGMHGHETSGLLVINKLIQSLNLTKGQIAIMPSANPVAQALKIRDFPNMLDSHINLNRCFPGKANDEYSLAIAKAIAENVADSDLVIDLHTFSLPCPVVGILADGPRETVNRSHELFNILQPDIIWKVDTARSSEAEFSKTLGHYLHQQKKNFLGIELPNIFRVTEDQVDKMVTGLNRVFASLGMVAGENQISPAMVPVFSRFPYARAASSGLFIAKKKLLDTVQVDDEVGVLVNLYTLDAQKVVSPYAGKIIILLDKDFVRAGDKLFSVAQEI